MSTLKFLKIKNIFVIMTSWVRMSSQQYLTVFCLDFKWFLTHGAHLYGFQMVGFRISDPIQNPDCLQPNFFFTIWTQTSQDFRSPLYNSDWMQDTKRFFIWEYFRLPCLSFFWVLPLYSYLWNTGLETGFSPPPLKNSCIRTLI